MNNIVQGSYTSDGAARDVYIPCGVSSFSLFVQGSNLGDNWNSVANPGVLKKAVWLRGMANGTALATYNTAGAATDQSTFVATDGFTPILPSTQTIYGTTAIVSVSQAGAAVVTANGHGLQTGDLVRLTNVTNMQQISSLVFTVTRTGANTFTVPIDTSAFANPGAGGLVRRVQPDEFNPRTLTITGISQAVNAVISVATAHTYTVGAKIRIHVGPAFGMTQIDGLLGNVTAVGAASITVDIDTTGFTAFAYPTSAIAAAGVTFPQVNPVGETPLILTNSIRNSDFNSMHIGATVCGANGALVLWEARLAIAYNQTSIP